MSCWDGFGNLADGRPFWVGDFSGSGKSEVLFYFPGDGNWWLGSHDGNDLAWDFVGNTNGFGQVWDGRPFWVGDFSGSGKSEVLFYFPGDGNWWLGTHDGNDLAWDFVGNTGRPYDSSVRLHVKLLAQPTAFTIDQMVTGMREVYASANVRLDVGSTETLSIADADIEVGDCVRGQTTQEQRSLFDNRNNVGTNDVVAYVTRTVTSNGRSLNGCAAHDGRPSCVVARAATQWTLAHEVGHVLGLSHVVNTDQLMTGGGTANITNPPPDILEAERLTMDSSPLTRAC
jgi:Metallo-peptidase family M12B Reprolysin-like